MSSRAIDHARRERRDRRLLHGLVIVLVLIIMFPFVWLLTMSFKTDADIFAWPPKLLFAPTAANYVALWDGNFPRSFANSAIASVVSTLLAMLAACPAPTPSRAPSCAPRRA
jgi:multiple sugar transport system permease protein